MSRHIRVVVADDSKFVRDLIASYLDSADDMDVVAVAEDGEQAVELVKELHPDAVTLDVDMPKLSGLEALAEIMCTVPTPTVMVSGVSSHAAATTYEALQRGAVDFILKYVPGASIDPAEMRLDVISKVRAAADVKVVRGISSRLPQAQPGVASAGRFNPRERQAAPGAAQPDRRTTSDAKTRPSYRIANNPPAHVRNQPTPSVVGSGGDWGIIVIGASTGGPIAIRELIRRLPCDFPAPIIVVQHIPAAFTNVLVSQIAKDSPFPTKVAEAGIRPKSGTIYIAPGDRHLLMSSDQTMGLFDGPKIAGHRPSIDITMKSLAQSSVTRVYGVLLTGMGDDGASGLAYIRAKGGRTFAQSAETCVVNGMPQRALELGAVDIVGSPSDIAERLSLEIYQRVSQRHPAAVF